MHKSREGSTYKVIVGLLRRWEEGHNEDHVCMFDFLDLDSTFPPKSCTKIFKIAL